MRDDFQREITYLRVSVTDLCNLRCKYCMPAEGVVKRCHEEILRLEEIETIVRAAAELGVRKVRITGGEPLVRPGVVELCQKINAIDGIDEIAITTNGLLLERYAEPLAQAGVKRVNISLDTLRPDRFREITRGGELEQVLWGIAAAEQAGLNPIKINTVLIGGFNDDEVTDLVELTRKRNIEVRFIELMPLGPGAAFPKETFLPCDFVPRQVKELQALDAVSGVARLYQLPDAVGCVGLISPVSCDFCAQCDRIRLTSDGKLKPCLHSDQEIPLRGLTGEALRQALQEGIRRKPQRHDPLKPGAPTAGGRPMNRIGG
jgi:GTP 3',8-cyclase